MLCELLIFGVIQNCYVKYNGSVWRVLTGDGELVMNYEKMVNVIENTKKYELKEWKKVETKTIRRINLLANVLENVKTNKAWKSC